MIRAFFLKVLAVLAAVIAHAQSALATVEIEILIDGVAIADGVSVVAGHVERVDRAVAQALMAKGLARRV